MSVVIYLEVNGEEMSLWALKPSALFIALGMAQKDAGARITPGGTLHVRFTGEKPNEKNPNLHPQKLYAAKYEPPVAGSDEADPWEAVGAGAASQPAASTADEPPF